MSARLPHASMLFTAMTAVHTRILIDDCIGSQAYHIIAAAVISPGIVVVIPFEKLKIQLHVLFEG